MDAPRTSANAEPGATGAGPDPRIAEPLDRRGPAVVVVSHDTREEAMACLGSLAAAGVEEIVLVDSGSQDGTADAVRERYPRVRLLELVNVGFGRAANAGVRATSAEVVVVANADVRFESDAPRVLADVLEQDRGLGAAGPAVTYPGGASQASARRRPDLRTAAGHAALGHLLPENRFTRRYRELDVDPGEPRSVDWLSGCVLALRREAFESVGGFDPGYFLFVEDVDLGERLRAAGWELRYTPAAHVVHRVGASTSRRRVQSLLWHARSLDRYHRRRYGDHLPGRLSRPLVRIGLLAWVAITWFADTVAGRGRSSTGERLLEVPSGPPAFSMSRGSEPR